MTHATTSRFLDRIFPRMPDFYGLINEQCDVVVEGMEALVAFMEDGSPEKAQRVRQIEKRGDELKARNLDILNRAFSTPMDREDIHRAIVSVDEILNYAKTTTREMEVLELKPDAYTLEMAVLLRDGAECLKEGYHKLSSDPLAAEEDSKRARKAERRTEKTYRRALAELFKVDDLVTMLEAHEKGAEARALLAVVRIFKYREIYRHMSNGADRVEHAGEVLHDIVVKIA